MFEYFPGNYVWNLGVVATLNSGGLIDEVDRACRPIRDAATKGSDVGTRDFMAAWTAVVDDRDRRIHRQGQQDGTASSDRFCRFHPTHYSYC